MRLDDLDPTEHARDLGRGGGGGGGMGLLGLLPFFLGRRLGCGGMVLLLLAIGAYAYFSGGVSMTGGGGSSQVGSGGFRGSEACNSEERLFACRVMTSTEDTWEVLFRQAGRSYKPATINFFSGGAQSQCGYASSAVGPFYCPADDGVYLDTAFFDEMVQRFGARGDFAQAYVIAHEVGHHVQDLLGTSAEISRRQAQGSESEANALSVRLELQADCFAGVWAARNRDRLEAGDIEEGMTAANAIGDDTLQRQSQGRVMPDSFTHGTSEQRMRWLKRGLETGDPAMCDTFGAAAL
ncbi:KPN_02809 family neutral zinc metallopeptidase [Stakelama tenebrarum]|uniref:Zinc metalloprotease n=1 Tax=Stakelama tenebrarum TaxID=2711215 RepID=A0A6G6Y332_9SPHN|nr:neutral zinc metallopeptidase [Sphingosinithalassobacter tenebrarum]QIG79309.1 zinc metalloprotease [Sphingosinithalassobacter tenebrarum]